MRLQADMMGGISGLPVARKMRSSSCLAERSRFGRVLRGVDRAKGALVIVRPDQHVANVLPLDAHHELADFFGQFLIDQVQRV